MLAESMAQAALAAFTEAMYVERKASMRETQTRQLPPETRVAIREAKATDAAVIATP